MEKRTEAWLRIDRRTCIGPGAILKMFETLDENAHHVIQTQDKLVLQPGLAAWDTLAASISGRCFDRACEVRWIRLDPGIYDAWRIREDASGVPHWKCRQKFYLHGVFRDGKFQERNLQTDFAALYRSFTGIAEKNRMCFRVVEYSPREPGQPGLAIHEAALNQPRVVAHRLFAITNGQDEEPNHAG